MHEDPQALEEAVRLREQHEQEGHIKIVRELTELIAERWPESREGRTAQATLIEDQAKLNVMREVAEEHQRRAAEAVKTKRRDRGFGLCSVRTCSRPAAEPNGRCVEHRAGERAAGTRARRS
jgi:hypothetical protein